MRRLGWPRWQAISAVAAGGGVAVAAYLTRAHYDQGVLVCTVGDCRTVQQSEYAELAGVPIALLGLGMYLTVLVLGAVRWRWPAWAVTMTLASFAALLAGAIYAAYLTYVELFVIEAICQWCVASAVLTAVGLAAEGVGVWGWLATPLGEEAPAGGGDRPRASGEA